MRLPWSKPRTDRSVGPATKSQAALSGSDGDGKEHDLQYWIDSGFLTLPRPDPQWPAPDTSRSDVASAIAPTVRAARPRP